MDKGEYSTDYSESYRVSIQHELALDLLYQLFIIDHGEYSTEYSESCKVSTQH